MVTESIILGHKISAKGIKVDLAKKELNQKNSPLVNVKGMKNFLVHSGFYQRFIKDFSKITKHIRNFLVKENELVFDENCLKSLSIIKEMLINAFVII